ncbi:hypothetical protein QC760_008235 [Botrytis cinerea]
MRRPYSFTRTSSSHARYNPIYEETEAKKAEATGKSRWSFPFFASSQPTGYETVKPQPRKSSSPPPRTSAQITSTMQPRSPQNLRVTKESGSHSLLSLSSEQTTKAMASKLMMTMITGPIRSMMEKIEPIHFSTLETT